MYKIKWEGEERDINGILCDTNSYSNDIKIESKTMPIVLGSSTFDELSNNVMAYNSSINTSDCFSQPFIIPCNIPIRHGKIVEFQNKNLFNLKALWITNGKEFIEIKSGKKFIDCGSIESVQLLDRKNNTAEYVVLDLEVSAYFKNFKVKNYNYSKSAGAIAVTMDNKFLICYRQAAQKIADIDNWLNSLAFNYYCLTKDNDLSESIIHSGGTAGQELPKFINK